MIFYCIIMEDKDRNNLEENIMALRESLEKKCEKAKKEIIREAYYQKREEGLGSREACLAVGLSGERKHYFPLGAWYAKRKERKNMEKYAANNPEDQLSKEDVYDLFRMGDTAEEIKEQFPHSFSTTQLGLYQGNFRKGELQEIVGTYNQKRDEGLESNETCLALGISLRGMFSPLEFWYSKKKNKEAEEERLREEEGQLSSKEDAFELLIMGNTAEDIHEAFPHPFDLSELITFEYQLLEEQKPN